MSSKTKIIVLHMKEIIYTVIFAALGILIICLLFFMFGGSKKSTTSPQKYTPGVYTSTLTLNSTDLEVEVAEDQSRINSETVAAMYHLLQPAIEELADQICSSQSLDNIELSKDNPYTSQLLLNAIDEALQKASVQK